jgi:hypothetical protein
MGITEVVSAARSPWQNGYVERVIRSIRRECLDYIVIFNERHLRRVLSSYADYYHRSRTYLSLDKDCPEPRAVMPPRMERVVAIPQVRGLHHRYERLAPPDQNHFPFLKVARPLSHSSEDRTIGVSCDVACRSKIAFGLDRSPDSLLTPIQRQFMHRLKFRLK